MAEESASTSSADEFAQHAADRLALALEEAGFDVGVCFPGLRSGWDESGAPGVRLGAVTSAVASDLTMLLAGAVSAGVMLPAR